MTTERKAGSAGAAPMAVLLSILVVLLTPGCNKATTTPADSDGTGSKCLGVAKGIHPGRVVWAHDPAASVWDGVTGYWWEDRHTDPDVVASMLSGSLRSLSGESTDELAWDALFRRFNGRHGRPEQGYKTGEKISVKLNLNNSTTHGNPENCNFTPPQIVRALLDQLVNKGGVPASCILFYDASKWVPDCIYTPCTRKFPGVRFVDFTGGDGREQAVRDHKARIPWSIDLTIGEDGGGHDAFLPTCVTEADYVVNLASPKGHQLTGVSLCAKNHFGTILADVGKGYSANATPKGAGLHPYVAVNDAGIGVPGWGFKRRPMGSYNPLVDIKGHEHLGGKTLLFMVEGLYAVPHQAVRVVSKEHKWTSAPFDGNWTSSLFVSQDGVAIEAVALDFLRAEPGMHYVGGTVENYLIESALAGNPPSGTKYDPERDGAPLQSLGVFERWNNSSDKQYGRNLGRGDGIELVRR